MNEHGADKYRVMIVEDSLVIRSFFEKLLSEDPNIKIVAQARNGQEALDIVQDVNPEVIILDVEMPIMDGITALPKLLDLSPKSKVIMVSTLTKKHAAISIKALAMGASDYLEKPNAETDKEMFRKSLVEKVKILGQSSRVFASSEFPSLEFKSKPEFPQPDEIITVNKNHDTILKEFEVPVSNDGQIDKPKVLPINEPRVLAIGCSTGGPQALTELFKALNSRVTNIPILITQHMPANFTTFLAESINRLGSMECIEAQDGLIVQPGKAYLAPGDYHMVVKKDANHVKIVLNQEEQENFCRPAVDPMLRSVADVYGANSLAVIMTGMGQDGLEGAKKLVDTGGKIIIQDEKTSIVWGMPGAIHKANLHDGVFSLEDLASEIIKRCMGGA